ncbi:MAG: efflux RND transporter periplasmic adaptor subunit [Isosphaerales bacterium]
MNTIETQSVPSAAPTVSTSNGPPTTLPQKGRRSVFGKVVLILLLGGAAGGALYAYMAGMNTVHRDIDRAINYVRKHVLEPTPVAKTKEIKPRPPWDGLVRIDRDEAKNIGLLVVTVRPQVEPIKLELPGRTAYDPNSLNKIRPRFDTLVEKVHVELGQKVKKGEPLLDLFSTDLAAAKNDFQTTYVQWQHDLTLRTHREALFKDKAISEQLLIDTRNDENKSRLAVTTARQKLIVFRVPEEQIDPLIKNLNPTDLPDKDAILRFIDKAKMTSRSPVDGIVVVRDVVPGNFYDSNDVLMVIAPLDHLIVWLNVYEADLAQVKMGQHMEIQFPFLNRTILGTVQYVAAEVSKDTRTIKIRASVPNVNGELKADMLVRASLDIPPVNGQTVIPRSAVVVMNGHEYAFFRKPPSNSRNGEQFERREVVIAEERSDHVVVASGARAGEEVVSSASLILAQLYEDQQMVATGMPLQ